MNGATSAWIEFWIALESMLSIWRKWLAGWCVPGCRRKGPSRRFDELQLEVEEEFGARQAEFCGALLGTRRDLGLSLGDCVCLTTAAWLGAVAVTADRRWKELEGTVVTMRRSEWS
jgi:hypothetical protein